MQNHTWDPQTPGPGKLAVRQCSSLEGLFKSLKAVLDYVLKFLLVFSLRGLSSPILSASEGLGQELPFGSGWCTTPR